MDIYERLDGRPLTDPEVCRTLLRDTVPGCGEGYEVGFFLADLNGHLLTPFLAQFPPGDLDELTDEEAERFVGEIVHLLGGQGSVACFVVRHGPIHALDLDRRWQEALERVCLAQDIRHLGFYVMGTRGVGHLAPLEVVA